MTTKHLLNSIELENMLENELESLPIFDKSQCFIFFFFSLRETFLSSRFFTKTNKHVQIFCL